MQDLHIPVDPICLSSLMGRPPLYHLICDNYRAPKFSIDLKYLGRLYRYERDLCAVLWGPSRDVNLQSFPDLRCDNLGAGPEK